MRIGSFFFLFLIAALFFPHASSMAAPPCVKVGLKAGEAPFCLEIAADPASHLTGLQNRHSLTPRGGMLFVFPDTAPRVFWMKNTYVDLDILFLDERGQIECLASRVAPGPIQISALARYVVELAGGTAEKLDLWPGDRIALPGGLKAKP